MKVRLADGSGTIELKYLLEEQLPSGGVRIRFRRKGSATITLSAPLGSDDFMKEYRSALKGNAQPVNKLPAGQARCCFRNIALADHAVLRLSRVQAAGRSHPTRPATDP
jgi:hypothetical protein